MKVEYAPLVSTAAGRFGGLVFTSFRGGPVVRRFVNPAQPRTTRQLRQRGLFRFANDFFRLGLLRFAGSVPFGGWAPIDAWNRDPPGRQDGRNWFLGQLLGGAAPAGDVLSVPLLPPEELGLYDLTLTSAVLAAGTVTIQGMLEPAPAAAVATQFWVFVAIFPSIDPASYLSGGFLVSTEDANVAPTGMWQTAIANFGGEVGDVVVTQFALITPVAGTGTYRLGATTAPVVGLVT